MGTYPGFHFCLCHNTALGAALLITALKKKTTIPYGKTVILTSWEEVCIFCLCKRWGIRRAFIEGNMTCLTLLCVWQFLGKLFGLGICALDAKIMSVVSKVYVSMLLLSAFLPLWKVLN